MTNRAYQLLAFVVGAALVLGLLAGWVYVAAGNATPHPRDRYVPLTVPTLPAVPCVSDSARSEGVLVSDTEKETR